MGTIKSMSLGNDPDIRKLIELAKREDLGGGDLTAGLLADPREAATLGLLAKQSCVLAGVEIASAVLEAYDPAIEIEWTDACRDGRRVDVPVDQHSHTSAVELARVRGPLGSILSAERVLLNFLQRLCGVATLTRQYVDAVASTNAKIYDTRKTTPGWRLLEKYAVRCGGGENHRMGLHDVVLIKDNHLAGVSRARLAGTVFDMLNKLAVDAEPPALVEVEADTLEQLEELLKVVGIDAILLDNFSPDDLRRAVALRDRVGLREKVALEASGGINLDTVRAVAETGVERISVGAITHSAMSIDLSLERC